MQQLLTELTALMNKHGAVVKMVNISWAYPPSGGAPQMASAQVEIFNLKPRMAGALARMTMSHMKPPMLPDPPAQISVEPEVAATEPEVGAVCDHDWRKRRYDPGHWCSKCPATKI